MRKQSVPSFRPSLEILSARVVPATISIFDGALYDEIRIVGTNSADHVVVRYDGANWVVEDKAVGSTCAFPTSSIFLVRFTGGDGDDIFENYAPIAVVAEGGNGNDNLTGGPYGDTLYGDYGTDFLNGGDGSDTLEAGLDTDWNWMDGGTGDDTLYGGNGIDYMHGGDGNDLLDGKGGNDDLHGDAGYDVLYGGDGTDYLDGGVNDGFTDYLSGGAGDDYFRISWDFISDFGFGYDQFYS